MQEHVLHLGVQLVLCLVISCCLISYKSTFSCKNVDL